MQWEVDSNEFCALINSLLIRNKELILNMRTWSNWKLKEPLFNGSFYLGLLSLFMTALRITCWLRLGCVTASASPSALNSRHCRDTRNSTGNRISFQLRNHFLIQWQSDFFTFFHDTIFKLNPSKLERRFQKNGLRKHTKNELFFLKKCKKSK